MDEYIVILTTTDSKEGAQKIANDLVNQGLCACVNIVNNVNSVYKWKDEVVFDNEYLLVIKTKKSLYEKIEKEITNLHNYELPEIISLPIDHGSEKYLDWINKNTI